jgi:hypothetical protein
VLCQVAAERLQRGFSGAAAALKAPLHRPDSISAYTRRALRAAPQVLLLTSFSVPEFQIMTAASNLTNISPFWAVTFICITL